jgi:hypothetical protein
MTRGLTIALTITVVAVAVAAVIYALKKRGPKGVRMYKDNILCKNLTAPDFITLLLGMQMGDRIRYSSDKSSGVIEKGMGDEWKMTIYSAGNQRQTVEFRNYALMSSQVSQMIESSMHFSVSLGGTSYSIKSIGSIKAGMPLKMDGANDDFKGCAGRTLQGACENLY